MDNDPNIVRVAQAAAKHLLDREKPKAAPTAPVWPQRGFPVPPTVAPATPQTDDAGPIVTKGPGDGMVGYYFEGKLVAVHPLELRWAPKVLLKFDKIVVGSRSVYDRKITLL